MIITTQAVVLRTMKYRESSRIVTLYTRKFGKLSAIAKGARDRNSKFGSALQPMQEVTAVIYKKEARDLQLLSQCDILKVRRGLSKDIEKMAAGMATVELIDLVAHGEEENEALYSLLAATLDTIDCATKGAENALYLFETHLLEILGFRPDFGACAYCGVPLDERLNEGERTRLRLSTGGVYCGKCSAEDRGAGELSINALRVLQRMQALQDVHAVTNIVISSVVKGEIRSVLRRYLLSHIEGLRSLRSEGVFSSILSSEGG